MKTAFNCVDGVKTAVGKSLDSGISCASGDCVSDDREPTRPLQKATPIARRTIASAPAAIPAIAPEPSPDNCWTSPPVDGSADDWPKNDENKSARESGAGPDSPKWAVAAQPNRPVADRALLGEAPVPGGKALPGAAGECRRGGVGRAASVAPPADDTQKLGENAKGESANATDAESGADRGAFGDKPKLVEIETGADTSIFGDCSKYAEKGRLTSDSVRFTDNWKSAVGVALEVGVWQRLQVGVGETEIVAVSEGLCDRVGSGVCETDRVGNGDRDGDGGGRHE